MSKIIPAARSSVRRGAKMLLVGQRALARLCNSKFERAMPARMGQHV
jgi:hypothetical protein